MATKKKAQKEKAVESKKKVETAETPEVDTKALDAAQKAYKKAKEEASEAWNAVKQYMKDNKLKPGTKSEDIKDKKVAKGYKELKKAHKSLQETRDNAEAEVKALKPKNTNRGANGKWSDRYTGNETTEEKKKLRAKWRAEAKKAAKGEADETTKPSKKSKKSEAPAKEEKAAKPSKKDKKAKKSKAKDEDED